MIPAGKARWFEWWFSRVARTELRKSFDRIAIRGLSHLRGRSRDPLLIVSNHTAWWDSLFTIWLTNFAVDRNGFAMMDATNLRRYPFFAKMGAFGVDLKDPRDGVRAIRYGAQLLDEPNALVWVFAQGDERPVTERPLRFRKGAAAIAKRAPHAKVIPLALRYEFVTTKRPTLYAQIGPPLASCTNVNEMCEQQEAAVAELLDQIDHWVGEKRFGQNDETFLEDSPSAISALAEGMLSWLTRGDIPR